MKSEKKQDENQQSLIKNILTNKSLSLSPSLGLGLKPNNVSGWTSKTPTASMALPGRLGYHLSP